jgi:hypothetical protein
MSFVRKEVRKDRALRESLKLLMMQEVHEDFRAKC